MSINIADKKLTLIQYGLVHDLPILLQILQIMQRKINKHGL